MSYATGAAATVDDILEAIENFAIAEGWTIGKRATDLLFLEKGVCHVALQGVGYNYTDALTGLQADTRISGALSSSLNNTLNDFFGHPDSLSTNVNDADQAATTQLGGGVSEYHLFSGDTVGGDPDYIHCVFRVNATDWKHLSFGLLDQAGMTHGGVAYLVGNPGYFYPTSASPTASSSYYNDPDDAFYPFGGGGFQKPWGADENLYIPDALPNAPADWPVMSAGRAADLINNETQGADFYPSGSSNPSNGFNQPMIASPASQWGGNVKLYSCPVFFKSTTLLRTCYVGDYPNVRMVLLEGLTPGDELSLGGDTWFICPIGRQREFEPKANVGLNYTTGQYGLAFKKIV